MKLQRIVQVLLISIIGSLILVWLICNILNIEFTDDKIESEFYSRSVDLFTFCWLLIFLMRIRVADNFGNMLVKIIVALLSTAFVYFIFLVNIWAEICGWGTIKDLYVSESNPDNKIVMRAYSCGILDSKNSEKATFKIIKINSFLIRSSRIDTTKIDAKKWIMIK